MTETYNFSVLLTEKTDISEYKVFVEQANEGVWAMDEFRNTYYVNNQMAQMLGLRPQDMIGRPVISFLFEEDIPAFKKKLEERAKGISGKYDQRFRHNDGSEVWCKISATALMDKEGRFRGSFAFLSDITQLREKSLQLSHNHNTLMAFFNAIPESAILIDTEGKVVMANEITSKRLGVEHNSFIGQNVYDYLPKKLTRSRKKVVKKVITEKTHQVIEDKRGKNLLRSHIFPVLGEGGAVKKIAIIAEDITKEKEREEKLKRLNNTLDTIKQVQTSFLSGKETTETFYRLLELFIDMTESEYGFFDEVLEGDDGKLYKRSLAISDISWDEKSKKLYKSLASKDYEFRNLDNLAGLPVKTKKIIISDDVSSDKRSGGVPGGHPAIRSFMGIPILFKDKVIGVIGVANRDGGYDLKELGGFIELFLSSCIGILSYIKNERLKKKYFEMLQSENLKLRELEEKFKTVADFAQDWEIWLDNEEKLIYMSPSCEYITGYKAREFFEDPGLIYEIVEQEDKKAFKEHEEKIHSVWNTRQLDLQNASSRFEYRIADKQGKIRWVEHLCRPTYSSDGTFSGVRISNRDITDKKLVEERLRYFSFHDKLTGLYNRAYFDEELLRLDNPRYLPISIIMADINGLKLINDAFGHKEGDKLLKRTAKILKMSCRAGEIIARWGGDEFVILLPQTEAKRVSEIISTIKSLCIKTRVTKLPISISAGYSIKTDIKKKNSSVLIEAEDHMYRNKLLESRSCHSQILESLKRTLIENSIETEEHSRRVSEQSVLLGETIGLPEDKLVDLRLHASLHDTGKVGVKHEILKKKEKLTPQEWEAIKKHSEIGYRIANSSPILSSISRNILHQHEWWDGSGYPGGLKGIEIPLLSRIVAVVDAFDAMTSDRPHIRRRSRPEAIEELKRYSGVQFDPKIVKAFLKLIEEDKI